MGAIFRKEVEKGTDKGYSLTVEEREGWQVKKRLLREGAGTDCLE